MHAIFKQALRTSGSNTPKSGDTKINIPKHRQRRKPECTNAKSAVTETLKHNNPMLWDSQNCCNTVCFETKLTLEPWKNNKRQVTLTEKAEVKDND